MKKIFLLIATGCLLLASCGTSKKAPVQLTHTISLELSKLPPSNTFINMDYGIRLNIIDKRASLDILNRYDAGLNVKPMVDTYPEVKSFVSESVRKYMQTMGFDMEADINTDYLLQIELTQYQVSYLSGTGWMGTVSFDMMVFDENRKQVYPRTTVTGRASVKDVSLSAVNTKKQRKNNFYSNLQNKVTAQAAGQLQPNVTDSQFQSMDQAMNNAYVNALENVDWDRVAYFLKRAKTPSAEKNKQVQGDGDTALEHTVIRWFVDSAPKGADVFWRVVSSTPDVKNTNQVFLGTTPYESTESFDVRGLTYNNSGNVQIEISCEKAGYSTQKKRFNLRQAIDQKEISTKFNLVTE